MFTLTDLTDVEEVDGVFFGDAYTNNAEQRFEFELTAAEFAAYQQWQATGTLPDGFQNYEMGGGYHV